MVETKSRLAQLKGLLRYDRGYVLRIPEFDTFTVVKTTKRLNR